MTSDRCQVSAIRCLYPLLKGSPPRVQTPWKTTTRGSDLTRLRTISLHRRKARASEGPKTLDNVSSERQMAPKQWKT